jgi:hypothetical protein
MQFLMPLFKTSSLKSQKVTVFASVHLPNAAAAMPTPALKIKTSLFLNF